jgi:hypothetical protein
MENLVYALFLILDAFAVGAAVFGAWAEGMLFRLKDTKRQRRRHAYALASKVGFAATNGILLSAVIEGGQVGIDWKTWAYLAGLGVAGVGFSGLTRQSTDELAEQEAEKDKQGERFVALEERVTAEEARNTDIEEAAHRSMVRADEAEARDELR